MKGFRAYKLFFNGLGNTQEFVKALIEAEIWVEIVPSQPGVSTITVYLRQGDNRQYRDILDICIEQNVVFDIHDYVKDGDDE
jgi:hypothetical protein